MTTGGRKFWQAGLIQIMKIKLWVGIILLMAMVAQAQTNHLAALLQQGLIEEQANQNLDAAIADYQALATQFDQDRQVAATAVFRIGECYRMQGRTNEAAAQYERVLRDFSDQKTLATLSQENLRGMGAVLGQRLREKMAQTQGTSPEAQALVIEADREISTLKTQLASLTQADRDQARVLVQQDFPNPVLTSLMQQLNETQQQLTALTKEYSTSSLAVVKMTATLDTISRQIDDQVGAVIAGLKSRIAAEENRAAALRGQTEPAPTVQASAPVADDEDREIRRIQDLIQNSPDLINAPENGGSPPLADAASTDRLRVAQFLLDNHANVDVPINNGGTPLTQAASLGHRAMVELLLKHGANINAKAGNLNDYSALHFAVWHGFQAVVEVLLAHHADVNALNRSGETPLFLAARNGQGKIVQMLLAAGANPNVKSADGATPLSEASGNNWTEIVKTLLAAGANPNVENNQGRTPLSYAAANGSPEIIKMLLAAKADPNGGLPLRAAILKNNAEAAELLLAAGANPNVPPDRRSLLFDALSDTNLLAALLDAGAKVDPVSPDEWGWTPLGAAAHQNAAGAVEILLKHGANPNANMNHRNGTRPLHFAAYSLASPEVFELLLANGANPNVRSSNGHTPLDELKQRSSDNSNPDQRALAAQLAGLLRRHGALDKLPDWDRIEVSRPADELVIPVFCRGTNDWNRFTLLETILNFYYSAQMYEAIPSPGGGFAWGQAALVMPFPDLTHVVIVRPGHDSTNETRMTVDLINDTNGIDGSKDVTLEFGDVVEMPARDHVLGEPEAGLTQAQREAIDRLLDGKAQLIVRGQEVELKLRPERAGFLLPDAMGYMEPHTLGAGSSEYAEYAGSLLGRVLAEPEAQAALLASSDLSRVKVTRHDSKTGRDEVWIVDCTAPHTTAKGNLFWIRNGTTLPMDMSRHGGVDLTSTDLWLRDGDVIEVPEKP